MIHITVRFNAIGAGATSSMHFEDKDVDYQVLQNWFDSKMKEGRIFKYDHGNGHTTWINPHHIATLEIATEEKYKQLVEKRKPVPMTIAPNPPKKEKP